MDLVKILEQAQQIQNKVETLHKLQKGFKDLRIEHINPIKRPNYSGPQPGRVDNGTVVINASSFRYFLKILDTEKSRELLEKIESEL